eukprot:gene5090-750_t
MTGLLSARRGHRKLRYDSRRDNIERYGSDRGRQQADTDRDTRLA